MASGTVVRLAEWTKSELATGVTRYVNSKIRLCVVFFNNYSISTAAVGGGGNTGVSPLTSVYGSVSISGVGMGILNVNTSGQITLYTTNLGSYTTGSIYGVLVYPY